MDHCINSSKDLLLENAVNKMRCLQRKVSNFYWNQGLHAPGKTGKVVEFY